MSLLGDSLIDNRRKDLQLKGEDLKRYRRGLGLPIGRGFHNQPEAFTLMSPQIPVMVNGTPVYVSKYVPNIKERVVDVVEKDVKDETLATIIERVTHEAYSRGLNVVPVFRKGSLIRYEYKGDFPHPVNIARFLNLREDAHEETAQSLCDKAIQQSASFIRLTNAILTSQEVDYIRTRKSNGQGATRHAEEVMCKFAVDDPQFRVAYARSVGHLKERLMRKFGRVVTDRYGGNFMVTGYTEYPQGKLMRIEEHEPDVWITDIDSLKVDLVQRDMVKLAFTFPYIFSQEQVHSISDKYFDKLGFKPEDKADYRVGEFIADFEARTSWAMTLLNEKAVTAINLGKLVDALQECVHHFTRGNEAGNRLAEVFIQHPNSGTVVRDFEYVRKIMHERFYERLHRIVDNSVHCGAIKPEDVSGLYFRITEPRLITTS